MTTKNKSLSEILAILENHDWAVFVETEHCDLRLHVKRSLPCGQSPRTIEAVMDVDPWRNLSVEDDTRMLVLECVKYAMRRHKACRLIGATIEIEPIHYSSPRLEY